MHIIKKHSSVSNTIRVLLRNSSTGAGLTGLTHASSGLIISTIADNESTATAYTAAGSTIETITTNGTFAAPTATKCRFKEVDSTNHPGLYEIQIADARFSVASAKSLRICVTGASNLISKDITVQLTSFDPDDAVRLGAAALPNAAADAAGGLVISDAGGLDIDTKLANTHEVTAARMGALTDWINGGRLDLILDDILADTAVIGSTGQGLTSLATQASVDTIDGIVDSILIDTGTSIPDALTIIDDFLDTEIAAIKTKTDNLPTDPADQSDIIVATDAIMTRIGVAGAGLTAIGDTRLANLDAAVSSRMATFTLPTNFADLSISASTGLVSLAAAQAFNNTGTWTGNISGTVTTVTNLTNLPAITTGWITADGIADAAIDSATFAPGTTIPRCTLTDTVTTYTGNTPQTADVATLTGDNAVETDISLLQALKALLASAVGVSTGGGTTTITHKNPSGGTTRVVMTVDTNGNRSATTLTL